MNDSGYTLDVVCARFDRIIKRLIFALVVCVLGIIASNAGWLYAWMQYDYTGETYDETVTVDSTNGVANYIGNDGDIINGTDYSPQGAEEAEP